MDLYKFMCVRSTKKSVENTEMRLSGEKLDSSELLSILTPCSSVKLFSCGQLLHQPQCVKGAFLITPSPVHSTGLMNRDCISQVYLQLQQQGYVKSMYW